MDDSDFVDVLDSWDELMEHSDCFCLVYSFVFDDILEEFSLFHEFHDEEKLFGGLDDFVKLYDVGVPDQFEDVDLSRYSFDICHFDDFAFFEYFDSDMLISRFVNGCFDLPKSPFADCLSWIKG